MTLRVAVGGFGAIGKVVAHRLDQGIEGLALAAVSVMRRSTTSSVICAKS